MRNTNILLPILLGLISILLESCAPYFHQPLKTTEARLGAEAPTQDDLRQLPPPKDKIVAAVYKFRDQTGQYKPTSNGSSFSTAVTQGATTVLIKAMEESNWFTIIERENLSNLLNERKIIRSTRAEYEENTGQPQPLLTPLMFAGIMLEGGIISYDANVVTGGAGLKYFGAGGSTQYREDRVTIYLRAVSTSTGRILKTIYTTKTILSQQVDVGVFRFVKIKRLLEAETGFTYNEPSEMAVKEAIEKAVHSLIIEGVKDGLWTVQNEADKNHPAFANYDAEKEENRNIDDLGRYLRDRRARWGFGLQGGVTRYDGDYANPTYKPSANIQLSYNTPDKLGFILQGGFGSLATEEFLDKQFAYADVLGVVRVFPKDRITPVIFGGGGVVGQIDKNNLGFPDKLYPALTGGAGVEFLVTDKIGFNASLMSHYLLSDKFDGAKQGRFNDYFWDGKLGINFYFGNIKKK